MKLTRQQAQALLHSIQVAPEVGVDPVNIIMDIYSSGYAAGREVDAEALNARRRLAYGDLQPKETR